MINARISAVMSVDSPFVGTPRNFASSVFIAQQMATRNAAESSIESGEKGSKPNAPSATATPSNAQQHVERQPVHRDAVNRGVNRVST